ncbi:receptor-like protein 13 isoform X2 [Ipomoea triloba]|uniref:receptor-like protein 13 isoform X2 n=1 Tax=Ipomoea triloba TaxID=35885 RepID=UPI00125DC775|nr:receptor-like protein 13 isoform X2 [Ipomoea triloba]
MGKFILWVVVSVMVMNTWGSLGCLEEERIALLHLKSHITNNTYGNSLVSWVDDKRSDCCKWSRVTCSNIMKRVVELDLYSVRDERVGNWYINATVFLPFKHLNSLYLSENNLAGAIENGGFDKLSKLHDLKVLGLSYNNLDRNIFSSLNHLLSLKKLYLDGNPLDSPPNKSGQERLSGLSNLETLSMSSTKIEDNNVLSVLTRFYVPLWTDLKDFISLKDLRISSNKFQSFGPIKDGEEPQKLEMLSLSFNRFNKSIFQSLKRLPSLKYICLSENDIRGRLHIHDIYSSSNLEALYLDRNYIEGFDTFASLSDGGRQTKLETLGLANNRLNNNIFKSLKGFSSLKFLYLIENDFHGPLQIQDINGLNNLVDIDLSYSVFEDFENTTSPSELGVSSRDINNNSHLKWHLNNITCNMSKLLQLLTTLPSIKSLSLQNNNITSLDAIHALRNISNLKSCFLTTLTYTRTFFKVLDQ